MKSEKGHITHDDFRKFLSKHRFHPSQNDLKALVERFDRN